MKNRIILLILTAFTAACVPLTRFKSLQAESDACLEERNYLKTENEQLTVENTEVKARLARTERELSKAARDTKSCRP